MTASKQPNSQKRRTPPFGYFGSKHRIASEICKQLPPHNAWVEVFCGSAAMTLAKPCAPIEVINDIDRNVVNLFDQLRNNTEELCRAVALTPYAREELDRARAKESDPSLSELERARIFLVASMMAINGVFGDAKGGFSYSQSYSRNGRDARVNRWYNLPERISAVVERLRNVRIENRDACELVEMFSQRPATLLYIDPPYLADRVNGYNIDAKDRKFHLDLLNTLLTAKCMILISGYQNELYSSLLTVKNGWTTRSIAAATRDSLGRTHARTEVLWMNKAFTTAARLSRIPIRLSAKEKREGKLNPIRR
jgi:DNA adenine methylase